MICNRKQDEKNYTKAIVNWSIELQSQIKYLKTNTYFDTIIFENILERQYIYATCIKIQYVDCYIYTSILYIIKYACKVAIYITIYYYNPILYNIVLQYLFNGIRCALQTLLDIKLPIQCTFYTNDKCPLRYLHKKKMYIKPQYILCYITKNILYIHRYKYKSLLIEQINDRFVREYFIFIYFPLFKRYLLNNCICNYTTIIKNKIYYNTIQIYCIRFPLYIIKNITSISSYTIINIIHNFLQIIQESILDKAHIQNCSQSIIPIKILPYILKYIVQCINRLDKISNINEITIIQDIVSILFYIRYSIYYKRHFKRYTIQFLLYKYLLKYYIHILKVPTIYTYNTITLQKYLKNYNNSNKSSVYLFWLIFEYISYRTVVLHKYTKKSVYIIPTYKQQIKDIYITKYIIYKLKIQDEIIFATIYTILYTYLTSITYQINKNKLLLDYYHLQFIKLPKLFNIHLYIYYMLEILQFDSVLFFDTEFDLNLTISPIKILTLYFTICNTYKDIMIPAILWSLLVLEYPNNIKNFKMIILNVCNRYTDIHDNNTTNNNTVIPTKYTRAIWRFLTCVHDIFMYGNKIKLYLTRIGKKSLLLECKQFQDSIQPQVTMIDMILDSKSTSRCYKDIINKNI